MQDSSSRAHAQPQEHTKLRAQANALARKEKPEMCALVQHAYLNSKAPPQILRVSKTHADQPEKEEAALGCLLEAASSS